MVRQVDFDNNVTALYDAIGKSDWDAASHACRRNPIEAETWVVRRDGEPKKGADNEDDNVAASDDNILWRFLPLHSACARRPPSSFLRDLLEAYPEAASMKDESGMYPLHYACGNRASKHVIKQLIEYFPRAVSETDPQGMLPLHYIAQWGPSEDGIVESLLEVFAKAVVVLNEEQMTPLDLCREGNFDGWQEVLDLMKSVVKMKKKKSKRDSGSIGGGSYTIANRLAVSAPREIEKEDEDDLSVSSTIDIEKSIKSARSSSKVRRDRSSSSRPLHTEKRFDSRDERPSSRSQRELPSSRSGHSRLGRERPLSHNRVERAARKHFDSRDEISSSSLHEERSSALPPGQSSSRIPTEKKVTNDVASREEISSLGRRQYDNHTAARNAHSLESIDLNRPSGERPQSISCSLVSPRYHDLKTPRSSGRGPGFRSVDFDFEKDSTIRSQESRSFESNNKYGSSHVSHLSQENEAQRQVMNQLSQEKEAQRQLINQLLEEKEAQQQIINQLSQEKDAQQQLLNHLTQEREAQQQLMNQISQEKEDAKYQASALQNENTELRAKVADFEAIQNENIQLRAKLTNYDTIQNENGQLHAKLVNHDAVQDENAKLHAQLAKLQDIQSELSGAVDVADRRESARVQASTDRRKRLLEMLAMEEKHDQDEKTNFLFQGDTLGRAFGQQIRSIDGVRKEMQHLTTGDRIIHQCNNNISGYRMNGAFE
mmetsp:Transcript_34122/g.72693  ORF Transcript_34122/g.72693 Transcript_34122/m.72693 type:complete len:715 (+) Transcript_34122:206-2350(+)|eukprot:CAMPEP_0172547294 /NCGR_PEP_ID=MMETSP1067-20121228/16864_1 /TAXON_ID=265564 ORGANISM="Thalassiosira punctigera, Strain Tpunct2005C2" /NCGR_SAMPLE_ID=MMETSP1067 /ASSEMBLY_ACC=CAM_ASM_000444 /LENGTH=714 /DNA_ID=CAMNT_0013334365 /DNA_START=150 /DNA_END=2294 /DNA_ORIENTATION=-